MFENCFILHVDHGAEVSQLFQRALSVLGFKGRYEFAATVADAQRLLAGSPQPPDVVVAESSLRDGASQELLAWLRQRPDGQKAPVVVYSPAENREAFEAAFRAGAIGYLLKKNNLDESIHAVRRILEFCRTGGTENPDDSAL